jgi:predicted lipoprotein with Yx(FWY)xxD motif
MHVNHTRLAVSIVAGLGVLGLAAACGSTTAAGTPQDNVPAGNSPAAQQGNAITSTIGLMTISGSTMLVNSTGSALYTNDQDSSGKPKCVSHGCTAVWVPLTVPSGLSPTAAPGVGGTIAVVALSGGKNQVTMNGRPLYTFALDGVPGQAHGNGAQDTFDGVHFSWHSAVPAGAKAPAPAASAPAIPGY